MKTLAWGVVLAAVLKGILVHSATVTSTFYERMPWLDGRVVANASETLVKRRLIHCSIACRLRPGCVSFARLPQDGELCLLYDKVYQGSSLSLPKASGAVTYRMPMSAQRCPQAQSYTFYPSTRSCMKRVEVAANWTTANKYCLNIGARLPVLRVPQMFLDVVPILQFNMYKYWAGYEKTTLPGTWMLVDGTPADYLLWVPNHVESGACGVVILYSDGKAYLKSEPCSTSFWLLCEVV